MEASACAKIILLGEHAVVYGYPAIAAPLLSLHTTARVEHASTDGVYPSFAITSGQQGMLYEAAKAIKQALDIHFPVAIHLTTTIPPSANLGSSASLCVAVARALAGLAGQTLSAEETLAAAAEGEKTFHGKPSGIDPATIIYGKPLFFTKEERPVVLQLKQPLRIVLAHAGMRPSTAEAIQAAHAKAKGTTLFADIGKLVVNAMKALEKSDLHTVGRLMNRNHEKLQQLGVSSPKTNELVAAARQAGALGAKASGAGMGGFMVALCEEKSVASVEKALRQHSVHVITATAK